MTAPAGAIVRLYVDTRLPIEVGDGIQTQTGRRYEVQHVRIQERGKHVGRKHLVVRVCAPDDLILGNIVPIRWYRR